MKSVEHRTHPGSRRALPSGQYRPFSQSTAPRPGLRRQSKRKFVSGDPCGRTERPPSAFFLPLCMLTSHPEKRTCAPQPPEGERQCPCSADQRGQFSTGQQNGEGPSPQLMPPSPRCSSRTAIHPGEPPHVRGTSRLTSFSSQSGFLRDDHSSSPYQALSQSSPGLHPLIGVPWSVRKHEKGSPRVIKDPSGHCSHLGDTAVCSLLTRGIYVSGCLSLFFERWVQALSQSSVTQGWRFFGWKPLTVPLLSTDPAHS